MFQIRYLAALAVLVIAGAGAAACNTDAYCFNPENGCDSSGSGASGGGGTGNGGATGGGGSGVCSPACAADQVCCDSVCVNTKADADNCGSCGNKCENAAHATGACANSKCTFECDVGFADCDKLTDNGCEIDVTSDTTHCGDCSTICLFANATPKCESGMCGIASCTAPFADCNMMAMDGCEANLGMDVNNCKSCGNKCPAPKNANADCLAGTCAFGGCLLGYGDCDNNQANGCEVDLTKDSQNCGACMNECPPLPHATGKCSNAACVIGTCDAGYADCDASTFDGCESVLATDVNNCGACNQPCGNLPHAYPKCENSMCAIGGCEAGFADCDGMVANGCEVDLSSDLANCGACNNMCPPIANGAPKCSGFVCGIGSCNMGFADCFGGAADGCETNLTNDVAHCGSCGNACPPVPFGAKACVASTCTIGMCGPNHQDCNNNVMDGCETDTTGDVNNCGMCGNVCPTPANGTAVCASSMCGLGTCNAGYADCNNNPGDGCEFNTQTDPNNCGGCGVKCHSGTCNNAACTCQTTVLVIKDDSDTGTQALANAIQSAGFTVTISSVPSYQYNGTNPAPDAFGAVVVLTGGPTGFPSVTTDMPVAGQTALLNYVNTSGGGLVLSEWAAYHVASGRWQTLKPLVLLGRTVTYTGQVTYAVDPAFTNHPIWAGVPATFTFASVSNVGLTLVSPGVTRIAGSPQAIDAVVIRSSPIGRVAEIAHAGNYAPNGWSNPNILKLVSNAVGWVARCSN
jgi:hypothetical protein